MNKNIMDNKNEIKDGSNNIISATDKNDNNKAIDGCDNFNNEFTNLNPNVRTNDNNYSDNTKKNQDDEFRNDLFSFVPDEKVSIFIGAYGSGKSEVAVNFALFLSRKMREGITNTNKSKCNSVVLADLDMINPYFRSVDAKKVLNEHNIYVISPQFANTNVEVPALPGEIFSVFDQDKIRAVLDIGGEDLGARVVSSLKSRILTVSHATYMVVNMNRPFTSSKDKIIDMMRELEEATGLKTCGIVNNTNMLEYSNYEDLIQANEVLAKVFQETGVPLVFSSGMNEDYPAKWGNLTPDGIPFLRLSRTISYE